MELSEHLFRREWGRIVAALTRIFGVHNLALAEDVAQEAFCRAIEIWRFRGAPENPSAWLMMTAKNCALDALRRERTARTFAPGLGRFLESEWTRATVIEQSFTPNDSGGISLPRAPLRQRAGGSSLDASSCPRTLDRHRSSLASFSPFVSKTSLTISSGLSKTFSGCCFATSLSSVPKAGI
jgi:hypothetical protein